MTEDIPITDANWRCMNAVILLLRALRVVGEEERHRIYMDVWWRMRWS